MKPSKEAIARKARIEIYKVENEDKDAETKIESIIQSAIAAAYQIGLHEGRMESWPRHNQL